MSLYEIHQGKPVKVTWWEMDTETGEKVFHYAKGICKKVESGKVQIELFNDGGSTILDEAVIHAMKPTRAIIAGEDEHGKIRN